MPKHIQNPMCDGDKCRYSNGEVRVLPITEDSNRILCVHCFISEMVWRREQNINLPSDSKYDIPNWVDLEIYSELEPGLVGGRK